jgi:hypothetical protein
VKGDVCEANRLNWPRRGEVSGDVFAEQKPRATGARRDGTGGIARPRRVSPPVPKNDKKQDFHFNFMLYQEYRKKEF